MNSFAFKEARREDPYYRSLLKFDTSEFWSYFDTKPSPMFKDLIENVLMPKPEKRFSISEALGHPWFT